jgi:putative SOS response-associated peptidase YedK
MCGRFSRDYTWAQIYAMYSLTSTPSNVQPNFNVCPTTNIDVVISGAGNRALVPMRWGNLSRIDRLMELPNVSGLC